MRALPTALLLLAGWPAWAQTPSGTVAQGILRHYDALRAVAASQMLGVPMPLSRGEPGDWRLSLAPAYVKVFADPLVFEGASLNAGFSRLLNDRWGLYAAVLTNRLRSHATRDSGSPHPRLLAAEFSGLDGTPAYSGRQHAGGTLSSVSAALGLTYQWLTPGEARLPLLLFAGPLAAHSWARGLSYAYAFDGTYAGGSKAYRLEGGTEVDHRSPIWGFFLGASTEFDLGSHWKVSPHVYEVVLPAIRQSGDGTQRVVETCDGSVCSDTTTALSYPTDSFYTYFPIPGVDVTYRDWGLSVNLFEPFGGLMARTTASGFLGGAWPLSVRLTWSFGRYAR